MGSPESMSSRPEVAVVISARMYSGSSDGERRGDAGAASEAEPETDADSGDGEREGVGDLRRDILRAEAEADVVYGRVPDFLVFVFEAVEGVAAVEVRGRGGLNGGRLRFGIEARSGSILNG